MKVREIILEAPQTGTNAFSQMANQLGRGSSSTGGTTKSTSTGKTHTANPNNPNKAANTKTTTSSTGPKVDLKTRPIDILSKDFPDKVAKAKSSSAKMFSGLKNTKVFNFFGAKWLAPLAIWLDDMSAINELWESGMFNNYGNKAGEVAQQMRTAHTQLAFSRLATNYLAWFAVAKVSGMAARALMALIPGFGWIAGVASFIAQAAMFAFLQTDAAQKFITLKIIENIPGLDDLTYSVAKTVGSAGAIVPQQITQLRKQYMNKGADAMPEPAKKVADKSKDAVNQTTAPSNEPLGAMSDLAKDL